MSTCDLNGVARAPWQAYVTQVDGLLTDDGPVRVGVCAGSTPCPWQEDVLRCREALELLALIAVVEDAKPPLSTRRFLVSSSSRDLSTDVFDVEVFKAFFLAFDEHSLRDEFRDAMQLIFSKVPTAEQRKVACKWCIPIDFFMSSTRQGPNLSVAYLTSALELAKGIAHRIRDTVASADQEGDESSDGVYRWRYCFPYADVIVKLLFGTCKLERRTAPLLAQLFALGVSTDEEIEVGSDSALGRLLVSELGPIVCALTGGALNGDERIFRGERDEVLSLDKWHIQSSYQVRRLQAICSSLAVSESVKKLCISSLGYHSSRESRVKVLQWLMYSLFSNDSKSCLTSLKINKVDLVDGDMAGIVAMLAAKHPVKLLLDGAFGGCDPEEEEDVGKGEHEDPGFAFVKVRTLISIAPIKGGSHVGKTSLESLVLKQDGHFRVLRNDPTRDSVDIIVPPYGYCIVPRASVDHFATEASAASPPRTVFGGYTGSIASLKMTESNFEALLPLIDYIGPKLLSLTVSGGVGPEFLRHALAACPNLTSLKIVEPEERVEIALMEAYKSGKCKISSLRILEYDDGRDFSTIPFVRMLGDPASAAAKTLRSLELISTMYSFFRKRTFPALVQMLRVNRMIEHLRINMIKQLIGSPYEKGMNRTQGVSVAPHPLPLKNRHAFLSVVESFSPPAKSTETERLVKRPRYVTEVDIQRFDPELISLIFAFAAERVARRIEIIPAEIEN